MPTFRHFVAVGVGAALALSLVEPSGAKELPSQKNRRETHPLLGVEGTPSANSVRENEEGVIANQLPSVPPASSASEVSSVPEQPKAEAKPEAEPSSQSVVSSPSAEESRSHRESSRSPVKTDSNQRVVNPIRSLSSRKKDDTASEVHNQPRKEAQRLEHPEESPRIGASLPASTSDPSPSIKPADKKPSSSAPSPGAAIRPAAALSPQTIKEGSQAVEEELGIVTPTPSKEGATIVQSPRSTQRDSPAPEFLNHNPNPLLFPTRSEEVQVRTTQPITLQQAIELARRNSRTLEEARLALERNQAALQEQLAAEFPTAGVNLDFSRDQSNATSRSLFNNTNNTVTGLFDNSGKSITENFSASLQVNYDLFTAGRRPASIRQAEEQIRFQELEVERTAEQLRLDVTTTYYALQQADAQVDISQAAVTEAAQSLRDAQLLEQAGLGTRFDVLQAQVRLAEANQDLIRAQSQQRIARRQLVQLLNLSQGVSVTAADPIEVAGDWTLSLEQTIVLALKNRAELEQQLVQRDIGEQQRRIALSAIRPQASLSASYNILGTLNSTQNPSPTTDFRLGAALRWNFFDGGAARARARQARKNIEIAETQFANQRDQIRFQVEQAFSELNANAQNIQTATFALQQAEESLRLARLRFQAGVGTQTDVINQQTALTRARVNRLTAILDYNRALAQLQRATSNLPDSNLENLP